MFQLCACHSDIPQYNSSETFRNVPLLLSHVCLCAVRFDGYEGKRNIIRQLLEEYDIETAEDIQDALKDLLGGTIKEMMEAEMDDHLGYEKSQRSDNDDYRNGYKRKQVNSRYGSMEIEVPQDRKSTFEPQVVKKRQKDTRGVLSIR